MPDDKIGKIELAEMIKSLRTQLVKAQEEGEGQDFRFTIEDVEMEFEIAAEMQVEGSLSAKLYVLASGFKGNKKDLVTQRMKLRIKAYHKVLEPDYDERHLMPCEIDGEV